ncbi:hypothetical protein MKL09_31585 [Methylobacterium sp. J-048]|uniref:hypothetical protein n=1 Tax=Methylobacterium sp. J-048 TaxID=2836635 RepID=UPI001FB9BEC0|nr:hypothetical protein [Methylobacterium sp. J-048]MCJ2061048.1 hypothetical protein [Methylobacterium sp. J-048]
MLGRKTLALAPVLFDYQAEMVRERHGNPATMAPPPVARPAKATENRGAPTGYLVDPVYDLAHINAGELRDVLDAVLFGVVGRVKPGSRL